MPEERAEHMTEQKHADALNNIFLGPDVRRNEPIHEEIDPAG